MAPTSLKQDQFSVLVLGECAIVSEVVALPRGDPPSSCLISHQTPVHTCFHVFSVGELGLPLVTSPSHSWLPLGQCHALWSVYTGSWNASALISLLNLRHAYSCLAYISFHVER